MENPLFDLKQPEYSYMIGFIQSDGHLHQSSRNRGVMSIHISDRDSDLIYKFQNIISVYSSVAISTRATNFSSAHTSITLSVFNKQFRDTINFYGIPYGKKSYIVEPPIEEYSEVDYWRGIIDGDGSLGFTKVGNPYISLVTASENLALAYFKFVEKTTGFVHRLKRNKRDNVYNITLNNEKAQQFVSVLYYEGCLALNRKLSSSKEVLNWKREEKTPDRYWTQKDVEFLKTHTVDECLFHLGFTIKQVMSKKYWLNSQKKNPRVLKKLPNNFWTLDKCQESASNFSTKSEWRENEKRAYESAQRHKWMNICCAHMNWTLEACKESAVKFQTRRSWFKNNKDAYRAAKKNNWIKECCIHMTQQVYKGYWTLEICQESALKHQTKTEWYKTDHPAYKAAYKKGWIDVCCQHMPQKQTPSGYWTLEICKEIAKKFLSRTEWKKNELASYRAAKKNEWIEECCSHMIVLKLPNNFWDLESCKKSAAKFLQQNHWKASEHGAYETAYKNGWLPICTAHMKKRKEHTLESLKASASPFKRRNEWMKACRAEYSAARRNNWIEECCSHMVPLLKTHTLESCKASAAPFNERNKWRKACPHEHHAAERKKGWMDECCAHMKPFYKTHTLESCKKSAAPFSKRVDWQKACPAEYTFAQKKEWLEECCAHMVSLRQTHTFESCKASASPFKQRSEWVKSCPNEYQFARKNGYLEECCVHMKGNKKHTFESCKESAASFKTKREWKKTCPKEYKRAWVKGILDICCAHMAA